MDISSIQATTPTSSITTTQNNTKEQTNFASLLKENILTQASPEQTTTISPLMHSAFVNSVELATPTEQNQTPLDAMEVILDVMQEYISELADMKNPKTLPELHSRLENAEQRMEQFHSMYSIHEDDPLYGILTSLEILILQERYRFNRGTYTI